MSDAREYNFDGLVGPTHNYAGLSPGNLASMRNRDAVSNPKAAALEGLAKMRLLHSLGVGQAVLPPQERPHVPTLRRLGFSGSDEQVVERAAKERPDLLAACSSASAMWAANAATVSPSADTADGRVHFTPANLCHFLHRSIETEQTARVLRTIFPEGERFTHHDPLPATAALADEGAANHLRFENGVEVFVWGRDGNEGGGGRQNRQASQGVARLHQLDPARTFFLRQHQEAIAAGAFHNDVVAVANGSMLFHHEKAFAEPVDLPGVRCIAVPEAAVSLADAVRSYLFNSQWVLLGDGTCCLIAPAECREVESVRRYLESGAVGAVRHVDVRQSMRNGGGPACLRLSVRLTEAERSAALPGVFWSEELDGRLVAWVEKCYREELRAGELGDPMLMREGRMAREELRGRLGV